MTGRRTWTALFIGVLLSIAPVRAAVCPTSPDQTTINAGSTAALTDSNGNGWGVPVSGGKVMLQGTALPWTNGATQLAIVNGAMWYHGTTGWSSFNAAGAIASGPTATSPLTGGGTPPPTGPVPVTAPLASATPGTWVTSQQFTSFANGPGGKPLQYGYLLPQGYDPVHFTYPIMFVGAGNGQGMNGGTYPRDGNVFIAAMESDSFRFNTVAFRTAHPAIIVAPQCDQTIDGSGGTFNANCGGYGDAPNTSWAEQSINALMAYFIAHFSVTPGQHYGVGLSLSAIGYLAQMVDNNSETPQGSGLWDAGIGMSTQLVRNATPNSAVFSRMRAVPYWSICSPGDNPCNYDLPFWQSITGNTNYPVKSNYDSSGMAGIRAGTSNFYLINTSSGTAYGAFGCMNADGCDGTAGYAWLFQQKGNSSGGTVVTPPPTCTPTADQSTVLAGSGGAITDASCNVWTITSGAQEAENGSTLTGTANVTELAYAAGVVWQLNTSGNWYSNTGLGPTTTNPLTGVVTPPPPPPTGGTGAFHVSNGQIIAPNGTVWYGAGVDIHSGNLGSLTGTGPASIAAKFPGTNLVRVDVNPLDNNPAGYDSAVTALTNAGIVVQFSDYTNTAGGAGGAQGTIYVGSQLSNQLAWFTNMGAHFKNNPYVWMGSNNEPTATYPDGQVHATGSNSFSAWLQAQYNAVRAAGNNNIFVLDPYGSRPIGYGGTPEMSATDPAYFANMTNVIWDPHVYGYQNGYSTTTTDKLVADMISSVQTVRSKDGLVPAIIGEFGPGNNLQTQDPNGTQLVASVLKNKGSGFGAWVMDTDGAVGGDSSGNNALLSRNNLTPYGSQVAAGIVAAIKNNGGGIPAGEHLNVNTIANVAQNTVFTVSGTITGVTSAPTLQYADNGGAWLAMPSGATVNAGTFSFQHPGMTSNSAATVSVRDANNNAISATGPPFAVLGAASPNGTTVSPGAGTFTDGAHVYSIDGAGNAIEDGGQIAGGSGTGAGEWYNGQVYFQDANSGTWFTWNQTTFSTAAAPGTVVTPPPNETLAVNAVGQQTANAPFTVSGVIGGLTSAPTLQYQDNNGLWQPLPGGSGSTATRSQYNQPGGNGSAYNTPFGTGSIWTNQYFNSICNVGGGGGTCYGNINSVANFGLTEYIGKATDPTFTFTSNNNGRTKGIDSGPSLTATLHVPRGAVTAGPYSGFADGGLIVMDPTNQPNRIYLWGAIQDGPPGLQPGQGPFTTGQAEWDDVSSDQFGHDYDTGLSGYNTGAGLINACDVTPSCNPFYPKIKHAFRISLGIQQVASNATPSTGQVLKPSGWPNRLQDGQGGSLTHYSGNMPFGLTLGIPLTTAMPSGLDANCQGFFWSLQHYPTFMRDTNQSGINYYVDQVADTSSLIGSVRGCLNTLVSKLQVLTNQHQGGQDFTAQPVNGPGPRSDTGPLPLTASSSGGGTVTATSFSFTHPGMAAGASNVINIRDANNQTITAASAAFSVVGAVVETLSLNPIPAQVAGSSFNVSGSLGGLTNTPTLQYQDGSSGWNPLPVGAVVTASSFSFPHPGMAATSSATVSVRDATNQTIVQVSNAFVVTASATETLSMNPIATETASHPFTVSGTASNITGSTLALQYQDNSGAWQAFPAGSSIIVTPGSSGAGPVSGSSANGTTITVGSGSFSDGTHVYSINAAGVAIEDGNVIANSSGTGKGEWYNGLVYFQDANTGIWYTWNQSQFNTAATPGVVSTNVPTFADFFTSLSDISDNGGAPVGGVTQIITAGQTGGLPLVTAPLSGSVTKGTWQLVNFSGNGIGMNYLLLLPQGYSSANSYPLLVYLHENGYGNDQTGAFLLGVTGGLAGSGEGADVWFNNVNFRTQYPAIVLVPLLNENVDSSGVTQNWGGEGGPNPQASQQNVVAIVKTIMANYNVYAPKIMVTGDSLGGIGTEEFMVQYNAYNGLTTGSRLFSAGWSESGGLNIYPTPTTTGALTTEAKSYPLYAVRGANDNSTNPNWNQQMYSALGGGTCASSYTSAVKAPNGPMWCVNDAGTGHDTWGKYRNIASGTTAPATALYNWLFSFSSPATSAGGNPSSIVDGSGATWTIVNAQAYKNGVPAGLSSNVAELALVNGVMWQETVTGGWFSWSGTVWVSGTNPLSGGSAGVWMNHYPFGGAEYTLSANSELEYYTSATRTPGFSPFSLQNNGAGPGLVITVDTTPQASFNAGHTPHNPLNLPYNSGEISSAVEANGVPAPGKASFTTGYVEIQGVFPAGNGEWVGLVAYPFTGAGELDIIETGGNNTGVVWQTVHSASSVPPSFGAPVTDYSHNRHIYGVDIETDFITFYVDHIATKQVATPPEYATKPYYLALNLAIQGNPAQGFDGVPDATSPFPNQMLIDWVKIWPNFAASQTSGGATTGGTATWSFTHPGMPAASSNIIAVRDAANTNVSVSSGAFVVSTLESPNNTVVTTVGPSIIDLTGEAFTLTSSGQVAVNGTPDQSSSGAIAIAYVNHTVWYENSSHLWASKTVSTAPWSPQPGTLTSPLPAESLSINQIGQQTAGSAFSISGVISAALTVPSLQYSVNNGPFLAFPAGSQVTNSAFSLTIPGIAAANTAATITVRDAGTPAISATSNTFVIASAASEVLSIQTISNQTQNVAFRVTGTIANASTIPTLQYAINGGSFLSLPSGSPASLTTQTSFAFTVPAISGLGTTTVAVRDANAQTVTAVSNSFQIVAVGSSTGESLSLQSIASQLAATPFQVSGSITPASPILITTAGPTVTDAAANVWSLAATAGQVGSLSVLRNGTPSLNREADGTIDGTANVNLLLYYYSNIYYLDDIWWAWDGTYWVIIPADPRTVPQPTPTLQYSSNGGSTWLALPSGAVVTNTVFGFTVPGLPTGQGSILVRDANQTSVTAQSNTFQVAPAGSEELTMNGIGSQPVGVPFSVSGTILNTASAPTLQYADNGGSFQPLPVGSSVGPTSYSFVHPGLSAAQSMTVVVRDADRPAITASAPAFVVIARESPNLTTITTVGPQIIDSSGTSWTLTAGKQVARNGIPDATTSNVIEIAYVNRQVWYENANLQWWAFQTVGTWGPTGGSLLGPLPSSKVNVYLTNTSKLAVVSGFSVAIPGIVVNDTVVGGTFNILITATDGTLSMPGAVGSGTSSLTESATLASINASLMGLQYLGKTVGSGVVSLQVTDPASSVGAANVNIQVVRPAGVIPPGQHTRAIVTPKAVIAPKLHLEHYQPPNPKYKPKELLNHG